MTECEIKGEKCGYKCTGFEGAKIWEKRMKVTKEIECQECRDHAVKDESAFHDMVSAGLGKKPHNTANLKRFANQVKCVFDECVKSGRC